MLVDRLAVRPWVRDALAEGRPVVALESTLISHGLPHPANVEVARAAEAGVREAGAVPATVAVRAGRICVGLSDDELETLATAPPGTVAKAARATLSAALLRPADHEGRGGWAATTVSATMIAAHAAGIGVVATGGIGGVHRGALTASAGGHPPTFDISADLEELARTPVAVVCAGPKAILDVPATLEILETRGVPVVTIGQDVVPGFFARRTTLPTPVLAPDERWAAAQVGNHLALGLGTGILVCVPVPEDDALPDDVARDAVARAIDEAEVAGIAGPALTPWLLGRIAELTEGASVRANTALIVNNARVAGRIASRLAAIEAG